MLSGDNDTLASFPNPIYFISLSYIITFNILPLGKIFSEVFFFFVVLLIKYNTFPASPSLLKVFNGEFYQIFA